MRIQKEFPRAVREIENTFISTRDGTKLAARIWLPEDAEESPVPAIFEYIPYRKRDLTAQRDAVHHPYFAGHGYAAVRVDIRGSGDSEGVLTDEYLQSELDDGVDVIAWLAEQPWCTGKVGMFGISWGGFNGLQIASLQPPALSAVVTMCSTDDRYADDVHYMGGCLLGDNLSWASTMLAYNSMPPHPDLVGDRWRDLWMQRLRGSGLWLKNWLEHQHRDDFWKHGSICEDWSKVTVPVLAGSGWADGYSNAVFRLLENLSGPRLGLIGPWSHKYPHLGVPGPAIGFLQECLRFWDRWLKGKETGIMSEPMLRVWMQDSCEPSTGYELRPGRWIGEPQWPSDNVTDQEFRLSPHHLVPMAEDVPEMERAIQSPGSVGLFSGKWCSYSAPPDLPDDQREEDGGSLVFETFPLTEGIEILGSPYVHLELESDQPVAMVAVRLSDVLPDGKATRITYGLLNLTHRDGHEEPKPIVPGQRMRVSVKMNRMAQRIPRGHSIRLSVSSNYWPLAWPSPEPVTLRVFAGVSTLAIPMRRWPSETDEPIVHFEEPQGSAPLSTTVLHDGEHRWRVIRDLGKNTSELEVINDRGLYVLDDLKLELENSCIERYTMSQDDVQSARGETHWVRGLKRGEWSVRTESKCVLTCDAQNFRIRANLDAFEGDTRIYSQNWDESIRRRLV